MGTMTLATVTDTTAVQRQVHSSLSRQLTVLKPWLPEPNTHDLYPTMDLISEIVHVFPREHERRVFIDMLPGLLAHACTRGDRLTQTGWCDIVHERILTRPSLPTRVTILAHQALQREQPSFPSFPKSSDPIVVPWHYGNVLCDPVVDGCTITLLIGVSHTTPGNGPVCVSAILEQWPGAHIMVDKILEGTVAMVTISLMA